MTSNRQMVMALGGIVVGFAAGALLFVWPVYRDYARIESEIVQLQARIRDLGGQTDHVTELAMDVNEARRRVANELKAIPDRPELADVIRRLSLRMDGRTVLDQEIAAGAEADAVVNRPDLPRAMPLTVEITARFDSVFALLRSAETMNRLMRVSSVRLSCNHEADVEPPIIEATLGLDAIYAASFARDASQ